MRTLLLATLPALLLAGCASDTASFGPASRIQPLGRLEGVTIDAPRLSRPADRLQAQVTVTGLEGARHTLYYRFAWLNEDGYPAAGQEDWKRIDLAPGQQRQVDGIAPVAQASDLRFEVQTP